MKKIVISTGGGDAPGLNAVIFAVVNSAHLRGWEVYGSRSGYKGLLDLDELVRLTPDLVEDITPTGGTILGSTNNAIELNLYSESLLSIANTKLIGNLDLQGETINCFNVYNANYTAVNCQ